MDTNGREFRREDLPHAKGAVGAEGRIFTTKNTNYTKRRRRLTEHTEYKEEKKRIVAREWARMGANS